MKPLGKLMLRFLEIFGLVDIQRDVKTQEMIACNNLTLINLVLVKFGPAREDTVVRRIIAIHVLCSCIAFGIRYGLAGVFF
jgi:UDP-N-acetylglucosamine--dolichyl-phosphate N-acetylglucosaminephosphotransferase